MGFFVGNSNTDRLNRRARCAGILLLLLSFGTLEAPGHEVEVSRFALGTTITLILDTDEIGQQGVIIDAVFNETERLERLLSGYKYDSQVSYLNRNGSISGEIEELTEVINQSRRFSLLSNGAFDVTVKPVLDLFYNCHMYERRRPTGDELENALKLVGYQGIRIRDQEIVLKKPGMGVTLDGIAKGYIIDRAIEILVQNGISRAFFNAGGDIRVIGEHAVNVPWKVALQDPQDDSNCIAIVHLNNKAIATSGDYTQYFFSDRNAHHIVDPRTGESAVGLMSATVVTDRAMDADALATSVMVLGQAQGVELIERLPHTEALIITKNREILTSSGFDKVAYIPPKLGVVGQLK
ncbi:MAG: FAD:protein FMN transferase [Candidatus Latescibacteria bacterium]|nr:FAD:protein FMN transferase [Candidatus Latescibacterota bacterium]